MLNGLKIYHGCAADFFNGCGVKYPALAGKEGKLGNVLYVSSRFFFMKNELK